MKKHTTKRALLSSALSLLLCVAMLIGTTFAWFTDSVTSANNIIKSGNLKVDMQWKDAVKDGAEWADASTGPIFNYDLWEPGYVEAKNVKISNKGTLALKYQLNIIANGEVSELADVIDVYYAEEELELANRDLSSLKRVGTLSEVLAGMPGNASGDLLKGESDTVTIALKMQESAGNEYQNKEIGTDFSVQLLATQMTAETDSFDNQYDKDATYDEDASNKAISVKTAAELEAAIEGDNGNIVVAADIDDFSENPITIPAGKKVTLDLKGHTLKSKANTVAIEVKGEMTIKNGVLTKEPVTGDYPSMPPVPVTVNNGTLTLEKVIVNVPTETTYDAGITLNTGTLNLNEGTVINVNGTSGTTYGVWVLGMRGNTINFNGGKIVVNAAADADAAGIYSIGAATINATSGELSVNDANAGTDHIGVYTYGEINMIVGNGFTFDIAEGATKTYGNVSQN